MTKLKIGLLPLYLELYDECAPEKRSDMELFAKQIAEEYEKRGVKTERCEICRIETEFARAIEALEKAGADAIVTLHLAYSPSLESAEALAKTKLPVVVLDTTQDYNFGIDQKAEAIMFNHGIHGVQDMCNLFVRNGKRFLIEAGHWQKSNVIERSIDAIKACAIIQKLKQSRVGLIGEPFKGMGDFALPFDKMKELLGIETVTASQSKIMKHAPKQSKIEDEIEIDRKRFLFENIDKKILDLSMSAGLATRTWIEEEKLSAFTMNFMDIDGESGLPTPPFLEASKAMSRGTGYAGEGDVLTAALTGSLLQVFPDTTFTEMFCPDWEGNKIFLTHMGEMNISLTAEKPELFEKPFPYTSATNPAVATGCFKEGSATFVNLAPGPNDTFTLIAAPVELCDDKGSSNFKNTARGWAKPQKELSVFLKEYSICGGTHHLAMSYGDISGILEKAALLAGWNFKRI